ncbi:hypothetical protein EJ110_NYTH01994, partial [Nymphaea thermarum]
ESPTAGTRTELPGLPGPSRWTAEDALERSTLWRCLSGGEEPDLLGFHSSGFSALSKGHWSQIYAVKMALAPVEARLSTVPGLVELCVGKALETLAVVNLLNLKATLIQKYLEAGCDLELLLLGSQGKLTELDPSVLMEKLTTDGDHESYLERKPTDAGEADGDEDDDDDNENGDGEGEEELSSEDGGGDEINGNKEDPKKGPNETTGGSDGEGEENGGDEDGGDEDDEGEDDEGDDDEEEEEDGEDGGEEEEEVVEEEDQENDEEDEEEEAIQPPKKRKK